MFLFQANQRTNYLAYSKTRKPNLYLLMFAFWIRMELVDPCIMHCHISMEKLIFISLKYLQGMIRQCVVVFEWMWLFGTLTLNYTFSLTSLQAKHWMREYSALCYLQLIYLMQLQFTIDKNVFLDLFGRRDYTQIIYCWWVVVCVKLFFITRIS